MKKSIVTIILIIGIIALVGCKSESYHDTYAYLSKNEKLLLKQYYDKGYCGFVNDCHDKLLLAVRLDRSLGEKGATLPEGRNLVDHNGPVFCNHLDILESIEKKGLTSTERRENISLMWEDLKGETLRKSCGYEEDEGDKGLLPDEYFTEPELEGTKTTNYVSVEDYKELLGTVQDCNIAKVKLISFMGTGLLTLEHKEQVESLTLSCAHDRLRAELNK